MRPRVQAYHMLSSTSTAQTSHIEKSVLVTPERPIHT